MPLIHSKKPSAFVKNIKSEIHAGKPQKQAVAIAYDVKRRAEHKKSEGGEVHCSHGGPMHCMHGCYAKGGEVGSHKENHAYNYDASKDMKGVHEVLPRYNREHNRMQYGESTGSNTFGGKEKHKKVLEEIKSMPNPKLKGLADGGPVLDPDKTRDFVKGFMGHAEGGEIESPEHESHESGEHELAEMAADELMSAIESKNKEQVVSAMKALVAACMDYED